MPAEEGTDAAGLGEREQALARANEQLAALPYRDELTGVDNRRAFDDRLNQEIARVGRHGGCFSLMLVNGDHFTAINTAHGHAAGDAVLRTLSHVIESQIRQSDWFGRYGQSDWAAREGGDEFAVLLTETEGAGAEQLAERIRQAMEVARTSVGEEEIGITVSIGIAGYPEGAGDLDALVERAEQALDRAKQEGRNRVYVYRESEA